MKITVKIKILYSLFVKKKKKKKQAFYEFSAKSLAKKIENVVYWSEITARTLTICDRTADVTNCADVTPFLHATSGGLSLTAAFFSGSISHVLLL